MSGRGSSMFPLGLVRFQLSNRPEASAEREQSAFIGVNYRFPARLRTADLLLVQRGQIGAVIGVDHEDGEQARWLGGARVFADSVMRTRCFHPAFARAEHPHRAVIYLTADRARE